MRLCLGFVPGLASAGLRRFLPIVTRDKGEVDGEMRLSQDEQERLLTHMAADLAARRRARGLRLNQREAVAMIEAHVLEGAREGRSVAELVDSGRRVLSRADVLDGVAQQLAEVRVEAPFPDGMRVVTVPEPVA